MKKSIRIETRNGYLLIKRINPARFKFYGFGSFLYHPKKEEISISQEALDLLKTRVGKEYTPDGDLSGFSLSYNDTSPFKDQRGYLISYGGLMPTIEVDINYVLIDLEFYNFIKDIRTTKTTLKVEKEDKKRWQIIEKASNQEASDIIDEYYKTPHNIRERMIALHN